MKPRQTAVLIVVFAALAIFAWTLREQEPRQMGPGAPTPTPGPILDFQGEDVTSLAVSGEGTSYELTRDDADDWLIDGRPAADTVNGIVNGVSDLTVRRTLPADRNPDDYGFAAPWITVTYRVSDTERILFVGDEVPTASGDRYVRLDEGPLHTVGAFDLERLHEWLTEPPDAPTPTPEAEPTSEDAAEDAAEEPGEADDGDAEGADGPDDGGGDATATTAPEESESDDEADGTATEPTDGATEEPAEGEETEDAAEATPTPVDATATPEAAGGDSDDG